MKKLWLFHYLLTTHASFRLILVTRVLPALKLFLLSEAFDITLFWLALLLIGWGVSMRFTASTALIVSGVLLLLSVKPIGRWIQ